MNKTKNSLSKKQGGYYGLEKESEEPILPIQYHESYQHHGTALTLIFQLS